ncbi:hypothetical protein CARUB_v10013973mg [Capsella rubella]|uniref:F-box domain-containing protein n=1 Tax=Capsella rubella TaxID=81985 RepID=R0G5J7_9BRAS|nr:F-box protein ETP2 [Capsella rubella]EOA30827.1 hypothetical protein CARUB_v10013973mg [Capsella rubella]
MMTARRSGRRLKSKTLSINNSRSSTKSMPELPKDLVEEILCRVPATSLNRLRTTCKAWNRLLEDDRRFARKHLDEAAKEFLPLMLTKDYEVHSFSVNPRVRDPSIEWKGELKLLNRRSKFIDCVFHCDGLLLCTSEENESRIVVWNPFTRQTRLIDVGLKMRGFIFNLGYSQDNEASSAPAPGWDLEILSPSVSLKGNIYRFATDEKGIKSLLKFDFSTEKSEPVPLPYQCDRYGATILSAVRDEKLSVLLQKQGKGSKTEIWVTNEIHDTKAVFWTKVLALDLESNLQINDLGSFLLDEDTKVVQICQRWFDEDEDDDPYNIDMLYVFGEDTEAILTVDEVPDITECWPAVTHYVPSFVHIKRLGGKRKRGG